MRTPTARRRVACLVSGGLLVGLTGLAAGTRLTPAVHAAASNGAATDTRTIQHVLNRVAFGPRGRDVEAVRSIGLTAYLEQQLRPERLPDPELDRRLAALETLAMTSGEIVRRFARPLFEARRDRRGSDGRTGRNTGSETASRHGNFTPPVDPAVARAAALPLLELSQQKVLRAIYSSRQLEAVLTDFWFNHFNVDAGKALDRFFLTEYEREAIRPHVLGRFRDLLGATAKSPAMLFYLDNWLSADPDGPHDPASRAAGRSRPANRRQRGPSRRLTGEQPGQLAGLMPEKKGLNENYARELMELHTLGVDGGYTQQDVTEVARAFTGWTIDRPRRGGAAYRFDPRLHDPGDKVVLGQTIAGGAKNGEQDGEAVLDLLARHPSTARSIARALARRFVSDEPPARLVDRLAARFRATDGDLREVMRTLLAAPEFLSPAVVRVKTKTPFEFVASAIRAVDGDVIDARRVVQLIAGLGMPLYRCQPPTGYSDGADAWTNAGSLVARLNAAQLIAAGAPASGLGDAAALDGTVVGELSQSTASVVAGATTAAQRVALTLGSPEFQQQ